MTAQLRYLRYFVSETMTGDQKDCFCIRFAVDDPPDRWAMGYLMLFPFVAATDSDSVDTLHAVVHEVRLVHL